MLLSFPLPSREPNMEKKTKKKEKNTFINPTEGKFERKDEELLES